MPFERWPYVRVKGVVDYKTFEQLKEVSAKGIVGSTRYVNCALSQKRK